jgi:Kef-type K+ transport system membrane component KefB
MGESLFSDFSIIIIGCAALSWLALILRQPIIIAYLLGGLLLRLVGPELFHNLEFLDAIAELGITLLLFLAGLVLHPRRLNELFRQTLLLTVVNSIVSFGIAWLFCLAWGYSLQTAALISLPLIFSSTILVLKLLPTTALHHKRMGAYCIAILIAQDIIAIILLVLIGSRAGSAADWLLLPAKGILLIAGTFVFEQHLLRRIMHRCERFQETTQLIALGWCLLIALLSHAAGLSYEIGAFIAGVALARSPISYFLSEQLKPFRDFFLVFFFFVLGTRFDIATCSTILLPALLLALVMMGTKYVSFRTLFRAVGEDAPFAHETGARLAQASEFSLILVLAETKADLLGDAAFQLVQLTTVFSLVLSSYLVVSRFPSPLASTPKLKQD